MLHNIEVLVHGLIPICYETSCPHNRSCANHITAGEFRLDGGLTPDIRQVVKDSWRCSQSPKETLQGAVLIDGTFSNGREDER